MSTLSVIIPTFNRSESLKQTLSELAKSSILPYEVIVIDQSNNEVIKNEIISACNQYPFVKYTFSSEPSSTKARNCGIDLASGDILVFMDDDVDVRTTTFSDLNSRFAEDESLVMLAGLNEGEEYIQSNSKLGLLLGRSSYKYRFQGHVTKAVFGRFPIRLTHAVETQWAMGFFFAVRRSFIAKNSLKFDENLKRYAYAEDLDFTHRLYKLASAEAKVCRIFPEIIVKHNISKEYRIPSRLAVFQLICHRRYLSHKLFKSVGSSISCLWSDFGFVIITLLKRENWRDYLAAIRHACRYSKDIKNGNFHFDNV